jgi:hypothetical protein
LPRGLSTTLLLLLLVATTVAFAITEGLKLESSPIRSVAVDKVFSPTCDCDTNDASIRFRLQTADRLTLSIVDGKGHEVATLIGPESTKRGEVSAAWDGRDDAGAIVPDGEYRPRAHLERAHRTIVLPNPIRVDTRAPEISLVRLRPRVFSPDGDGRNDKVSAVYRVDEPAHGLLFVDGHLRVRGKFAKPQGKLDWFGIVNHHALPTGRYGITLAARDIAGNLSQPTPRTRVTIRYVALAHVVRAVAGTRFRVRITSDAERVDWRFAGGTGTTRPGVLSLRAPRQPGEYRLFVEERGHASRAVVVVRSLP